MTTPQVPSTLEAQKENRQGSVPRPPGTELLRFLHRHWKYVLGSVVLTTGVAVGVSFLVPNWYEATASAVPSSRGVPGIESVLGAAAGVLRDIGALRLGTFGQQGYNFLVILESRRLKDSLIERFRLWELYDLPDSAPTASWIRTWR